MAAWALAGPSPAAGRDYLSACRRVPCEINVILGDVEVFARDG